MVTYSWSESSSNLPLANKILTKPYLQLMECVDMAYGKGITNSSVSEYVSHKMCIMHNTMGRFHGIMGLYINLVTNPLG